MVTRDGVCQGAGLSAGSRVMHSTDNGHPGDSATVCCGPPTLGFELVSGNVVKRGQAVNRVSTLVASGRGDVGRQQTPAALSSTAAGSPPQHGPAGNLLETGSLGEGGVSGARGLPGGPGGGNTAPATSANSGGVSSAPVGVGETRECAGCGKPITERFLLKALDLFWHEDCLKCGCCDCRLGEVGSTLYTKANLILCKRDYLRLFGTTGYCAACSKVIPAFEMVMRAKSNVYHLECFACQQCNHRFCVGDRFYLCDNKILCEYDYEERLVFANIAYNPSSLAHIRRQVGNLQPSGDDLIGMGGPTSPQAPLPYYPTLKEGVPVFCSGKTWSTASKGSLSVSAAVAAAAHVSGDEEASSGYGSPDSQPECAPPPVGSTAKRGRGRRRR